MARRIEVEIVGDSRSLERAFARSGKAARGFNRDATRASTGFSKAKVGAIGLTAALGVGGLATAASAAFEEMAEGERVSAQTAAALRSTGGAANVSADEINRYATELMNLSGIDDEAIKSGENLLLTFTNVRNEVGKGNDIFRQATVAMADMSVALGQDMASSATQLGKALNDPIKGVSALRRVGVTFDDSQIKLIKTLVATGRELEAQKLILQELQVEFGGSAEAAGDTLSGKLNVLRETALNLGGELATVLTPSIVAATDAMTVWLQDPENQRKTIESFTAVVNGLATAFTAAADAAGFLKRQWDRIPDFGKDQGLAEIVDNLGKKVFPVKTITDISKVPSWAQKDLAAAMAPRRRAVGAIEEVRSINLRSSVVVDGREIAAATSKHVVKAAQRAPSQTRGRQTR